MDRSAGQLIGGRYRLEALLGEGGMGQVWRAQHTVTGRSVALKFLRSEYASRPDVRSRFLREAQAACAVPHEAVVPIHDVLDLETASPALVMDFLEGEPLSAKLVRERTMSARDLAIMFEPVIAALIAAHRVGIVHRDLKPDNIFLARRSSGAIEVKVLDFGIAKLLQGRLSPHEQLTKTGMMLGTPEYMSPEQAAGKADVDHTSDIWSLGIILYECLSGKRPTAGDDLLKVLSIVVTGDIKPLNTVVSVPISLSETVDRMLSLEPKRRPSLLDLQAVLTNIGKPDDGPVPTEKFEALRTERVQIPADLIESSKRPERERARRAEVRHPKEVDIAPAIARLSHQATVDARSPVAPRDQTRAATLAAEDSAARTLRVVVGFCAFVIGVMVVLTIRGCH